MTVVEKSPEFANIFRWNAGLTLLRRDSAAAALLEDRQFFIDDPLLLEILELLTAPHRKDDLYGKLCPPYTPEAVSFALEDLCRNRLITTSASQLTSRNAAAFWDTISCAGPKNPIQVVSLIPRFGPAIEAMLKANGVPVEPDAERLLLVAADYLEPEVERLSAGRTLLPVRPTGAELWIGPLLGDAGPVCWKCLSYWLKLRSWPEYAVTGMNPVARQTVTFMPGLPSWMTSTCGLIATAASLWSAGADTPFLTQLCISGASGFSWSMHVTAARANCLVCPKPSREQQFAQMRDSRTGLLQKLRTSPQASTLPSPLS
jgi:bacteriocin biosynthesis cyclodehydratase domain-containing protein